MEDPWAKLMRQQTKQKESNSISSNDSSEIVQQTDMLDSDSINS